MREHIQHDRSDGVEPVPGVEARFAALLLRACDEFEEHAEKAAERDIAEALGLNNHPGDVALADLTDRLLTRCAGLSGGVEGIRPDERGIRGNGVLETWAKLKADGPEDGPLGTWSYTRQLALVARDLIRTLREHRAKQNQTLPSFVGRSDLPPIAPDVQ
ncbi:hypothetical protein Q5762_12705 [Streptomyces sp. P9(2023)]|uniref:hypothetical protein n=1 Tax=Streptomyces sp. P9(2023) TaxID=3064394 RepID=UPI0028F428CB|nr:hypothetical protein [Streptomyces sp. P9(2023)]MDT9689186.1 hypothetical protein [Streptomyces sp. P9(2023)]